MLKVEVSEQELILLKKIRRQKGLAEKRNYKQIFTIVFSPGGKTAFVDTTDRELIKFNRKNLTK